MVLLASDDLGRIHHVKAKPAARSLREPGPGASGQRQAATRRTGEDQGTGTPNHIRSADDPRAISGPLTRGTRGQSRLPGASQPGWSAPLAAVTARLPKLIVRVRFPSPAPQAKAQARTRVLCLGLDHLWALSGRRATSVQLARRDRGPAAPSSSSPLPRSAWTWASIAPVIRWSAPRASCW